MDELMEQLRLLQMVELDELSEKTLAVLRRGFASDNPEYRLAALEGASESLDKRLFAEIKGLLDNDPEVAVRAAAALSFGPGLEAMDFEVDDDSMTDADFDDDELAELPMTVAEYRDLQVSLRKIFDDPDVDDEVRRRALEAAVRSPLPWHADAIRRAFAESSTGWRMTAVFCAGHIEGFRGEISEALDHDEPEVRMEAIRAAASREMKALGPEILDLAKDPDTLLPLRLTAIDALVSLRPDGSRDFLRQLRDQQEGDLAEMATLALEDLEGMDAEESMWRRMDFDGLLGDD